MRNRTMRVKSELIVNRDFDQTLKLKFGDTWNNGSKEEDVSHKNNECEVFSFDKSWPYSYS